MPEVIVYTKVPCPYCDSAKRFLENRNISYQAIDLTGKSDEMIAMKQKWGWATFPIIVINGQCIGGYQDMKALEEDGKLSELLKSP